MREEEFRSWLARKGKRGRTLSTLVSDAKRIEAAYGLLETHYATKGMEQIIESLRYTAADQRAQRPNRSKIDVPDVYASLPPYLSAARRYREFLTETSAQQDEASPFIRAETGVATTPTTWIFQANPARFDIDAFFATKPIMFRWSVTRYADRIKVGDQVFIWRSVGTGDQADSGVIAEAEVVAPPSPQADDSASLAFWKNQNDGQDVAERVLLRLSRVPSYFINKDVAQFWAQETQVNLNETF